MGFILTYVGLILTCVGFSGDKPHFMTSLAVGSKMAGAPLGLLSMQITLIT